LSNRVDSPVSSRGDHVEPIYTTVIDGDRKYVEVSESFCELVGYKKEDLIGTRYDLLTVPNTTRRCVDEGQQSHRVRKRVTSIKECVLLNGRSGESET